MTAPLIYLFGYPGVGKNTIARHMESTSTLLAVQNHLISNALRHALRRLEPAQYTAREPLLRHHTMKAWLNFFEFVAEATPEQGLILTSVLYDNDPDRIEFYQWVRDWAKNRGRRFIPVKLICQQEQLLQRLQSPERKAEFKLTDPVQLDLIVHKFPLMNPAEKDMLTLDVTLLSPADAAQHILRHCGG